MKAYILIVLLFVLQIGTGVFFYQKLKKASNNYWTLQQQYIDVQNEKEELDTLQSEVVVGIAEMYDEDMETIGEAFYEVADIVDDHAIRIDELTRKQNVIIDYLR